MLVGIFGTGRNGSSLLTRLLDGIDNSYIHPIEINFLSAMDDLSASSRRVKKNTRHYSKIKPLSNINKKIS